jgi:hypothetical protein
MAAAATELLDKLVAARNVQPKNSSSVLTWHQFLSGGKQWTPPPRQVGVLTS